MEHDINPDGSRSREYRPYIFGEEKAWLDNLYSPFTDVNFGLYSSWEKNCYGDQHNCYDRLAPISHKQDVRNYANYAQLTNELNYNLGRTPPTNFSMGHPVLKRDDPFYRIYGTSQKNNGRDQLYRRLYTTYY
jgi:hypothetical protein